MGRFSVLLLVLSSLLITKGYLLVFILSGVVFLLNAALMRKIHLDYFTYGMIFYCIAVFFFLCRELNAGSGHSDYFISSFIAAFSYVLILLSVRFSRSDLEFLWHCLQFTMVFQAVVVYLRFFGLFEFPIPFGEAPGNSGIISLQAREQLTAVSLSLQFSMSVFLANEHKTRLRTLLIAVFSTPAVFLTGSTLAVGVFFIGLVYLFFMIMKGRLKPVSSLLLFIGVFLVLFLGPIVGDLIFSQYVESGNDKFEALSVISQLQDFELLYYKIFESNSRVTLFFDSISVISNDAFNALFGGTRSDFIFYTGGLSPHSIVSEVIALGGFVGLVVVFFVILIGYFKSRKYLGLIHFGLFLGLFVLTGTINSINLGIPLFGLMAIMMRRPYGASNLTEGRGRMRQHDLESL